LGSLWRRVPIQSKPIKKAQANLRVLRESRTVSGHERNVREILLDENLRWRTRYKGSVDVDVGLMDEPGGKDREQKERV
jgi:hypothetical protein